jgi:hypothetical protein
MDRLRAAELLIRGGVPESDLSPAGTPRTSTAVSRRYNGLVDPPGAEELGRRTSELIHHFEPSVLLIGQAPEDAVIAFVIARALGISVVWSYIDEGLVTTHGTFPERGKVVLLADAFRDKRSIELLASRSHERGCRTVAVAALFEPDETVFAASTFPSVVLHRANPAAALEIGVSTS